MTFWLMPFQPAWRPCSSASTICWTWLKASLSETDLTPSGRRVCLRPMRQAAAREASGGQQVIKSLILLVGLLKDEETPGGFVFIDEPFAHLDVRNIQLVRHFLKSTRAQYGLTTPITHNVEVFEPADVTLVTSKRPAGARWEPPIGVLKRRVVQP